MFSGFAQSRPAFASRSSNGSLKCTVSNTRRPSPPENASPPRTSERGTSSLMADSSRKKSRAAGRPAGWLGAWPTGGSGSSPPGTGRASAPSGANSASGNCGFLASKPSSAACRTNCRGFGGCGISPRPRYWAWAISWSRRSGTPELVPVGGGPISPSMKAGCIAAVLSGAPWTGFGRGRTPLSAKAAGAMAAGTSNAASPSVRAASGRSLTSGSIAFGAILRATVPRAVSAISAVSPMCARMPSKSLARYSSNMEVGAKRVFSGVICSAPVCIRPRTMSAAACP